MIFLKQSSRTVPRAVGVHAGFTLVELLTVIGIIAILSALVLASVIKAKARSQGITCLSNTRQLQIAWHLFILDHEQQLPPNMDQPSAGQSLTVPSWVAGWMRLDNEAGDKTDSTNTSLLVGGSLQAFGSLGPYVIDARSYKCTRDKSTVTIDGASFPRVRSVSMNGYVHGTGIWNETNYVVYKTLEEMADPSQTWVFIEEREDSINDGFFSVRMSDKYVIIDTPSDRHERGCYVSFADGHVEYKRWTQGITMVPLVPGVHLNGLPRFTSSKDRDLIWLTERTTVLKN